MLDSCSSVSQPTASLLAATRRPFMFLLCELAAIKGQFHIDSLTYSLLSCRFVHCSASQGWSLSDGGLSCQVRVKARMWRRQSEVHVQIKPSISSSALPVYQTLQRRKERKTEREQPLHYREKISGQSKDHRPEQRLVSQRKDHILCDVHLC